MLKWWVVDAKILFFSPGVCVCVWLLFLALISPLPSKAATISVANISVGKVIAINGKKFVKINGNASVGSQFVAMAPVHETMQSWNDCASLATPAGLGFTQGPVLMDARDGKLYEIRKFADGKCWMADNLMYGGATDNCAGVGAPGFTDAAYGGTNGMASYSNRFGTNTYGNCRDPRVGGAFPCTAGSTVCGYYYNWQGAMQHTSAYYNATYIGPTTNVQGICPSGWHLATGGYGGEFSSLDVANGGTGANHRYCYTDACNFWQPGYAYNGVFSGYVLSNGSLTYQGLGANLWSSSEGSPTGAGSLDVEGGYVRPDPINNGKYYGMAVRCIKN